MEYYLPYPLVAPIAPCVTISVVCLTYLLFRVLIEQPTLNWPRYVRLIFKHLARRVFKFIAVYQVVDAMNRQNKNMTQKIQINRRFFLHLRRRTTLLFLHRFLCPSWDIQQKIENQVFYLLNRPRTTHKNSWLYIPLNSKCPFYRHSCIRMRVKLPRKTRIFVVCEKPECAQKAAYRGVVISVVNCFLNR